MNRGQTTQGSAGLNSGPSQADVMVGRACLSFNLISRDQLYACVADQRRFAAEGRTYTLAQVMIGRKILTVEVYQQVVARIREHLAREQGQAARLAPPPDITASGRYINVPSQIAQAHGYGRPVAAASPTPAPTPAAPTVWGQVPEPQEEEIKEAARTWDDASSVVESASYEVIAEPLEDSVTGPAITPPTRERKDTGIRRLLGVPEDADQFDFGPYRILGEVAAGGMGVIYRALASETNQIYALKALINVEKANEKQLRRFIQEAQSAMRLDHPGIVKIHDIGIFENIPYFTMDLIDGDDLQHHIKARSFMLPDLLQIVQRVCEAVHYAHEHQVIHRDLKPANIIVRGSDRFPILTDFGLAKNLDSSFKLTAEGAMVGTPLFLSPEQVSGKGHEVDGRCDVYGLGVMLYQILTNRLPFLGRNPYEVYRKVLEEDATPPTQVNPQISPELEKICLMALAKDREERYATAQDMADDIGRFLADEPVVATLPTPVAVAKARKKGKATKKGGKAKGPRNAAEREGASPAALAGIGALVAMIVLGLIGIVYLVVTG